MFPLCSLRAVTRIGSDHVPLLFASGEGSPPRSRRFYFKSSWLLQPGFVEMVQDRWVQATLTPPRSFCATDVWHHCSKVIRQFMRGWGANLGAALRSRKGALLDQIKALDETADSVSLSADEWLRDTPLKPPLWRFSRGRNYSGSDGGGAEVAPSRRC